MRPDSEVAEGAGQRKRGERGGLCERIERNADDGNRYWWLILAAAFLALTGGGGDKK